MRARSLSLAVVFGLIVGQAAATDEPDELLRAKRVTIRTGEALVFAAKTPVNFDVPDLANDPTLEGGLLEVFDTGMTGGYQALPLPAAGWEVIGEVSGRRGWRYRGEGDLLDPCRIVRVSKKVVRFTCRDNVTLSPPFSGDVGVVLTIGQDSKRFCAVLGGTTLENSAGTLRRKGAPPPASCPTPTSPSGAFLDPPLPLS